jgi:hypothetical protein
MEHHAEYRQVCCFCGARRVAMVAVARRNVDGLHGERAPANSASVLSDTRHVYDAGVKEWECPRPQPAPKTQPKPVAAAK